MIYEKIGLDSATSDGKPVIEAYVLDTPTGDACPKTRPAILIIPGGGYELCSSHEGEPMAMKFLNAGISAFVLWYSVAPNRFPTALKQASDAMIYIRENASRFNIDPDKIAICGFSAGGHLAANLGTMWNSELLNVADEKNKPNAMILSYPVISSGKHGHQPSFECLCGDNNELKQFLSLENSVTPDTPKTFIWHTYDDEVVPMENTLLFANSLKRNNVEFEMHVFQSGIHGLSCANMEVGTPNKTVSKWLDMVITWLENTLEFNYGV